MDKKTGSITIELEGLEPGLTYFWRVCTLNEDGWIPSEIIRCEAPICPADIKEERKKL